MSLKVDDIRLKKCEKGNNYTKFENAYSFMKKPGLNPAVAYYNIKFVF